MSFSKKLTTLGLLGSAAILFSACNPLALFQKKTESIPPNTEKEVQKMAEAIKTRKSLHCTMTDKDGAIVEYYVKDNKTKVSGQNISANKTMGYMINNGEWVYIWEEGATEGMKNKVPTQEEMEQATQNLEKISYDVPDFEDQESINAYEDDGYTVNCEAANLSDADFTPPADINFVDFAGQIKGAFKDMEAELGNIELPEEFETMMEK